MRWELSRRWLLCALSAGSLFGSKLRGQTPDEQNPSQDGRFKFPDNNEDQRLPDGRSQKNAIAKQQHEQALKDADQLYDMASELRDELRKAGVFVVPVGSVKKTEEIERLAKKIRGRLKY